MTPFIGQILLFAGNFAIRGYASCDGQLLPISQNQALFSILGTIYGGDGRTTFALPDLRSRVPVHTGAGPGLSTRPIGQRLGEENVRLTSQTMPSHTHDVAANAAAARTGNPIGASSFARSVGGFAYGSPTGAVPATDRLSATGGGLSHTNVQPVLGLRYLIALEGVFPSRN